MKNEKKCKVLLLPTNEKASLKLGQNGLLVNNTLGYDSHFTNQHLYFLSNEEIKEGDWMYNPEREPSILQCVGKGSLRGWKKIIATTDKSLSFTWRDNKNDLHIYHLPQPSQSFIEKFVEEYNKGNQITEVMVEYNEPITEIPKPYKPYSEVEHLDGTLKINPKDNTITIRKIKDSWSRDEVEKLCREARYTTGVVEIDKWIEENL